MKKFLLIASVLCMAFTVYAQAPVKTKTRSAGDEVPMPQAKENVLNVPAALANDTIRFRSDKPQAKFTSEEGIDLIDGIYVGAIKDGIPNGQGVLKINKPTDIKGTGVQPGYTVSGKWENGILKTGIIRNAQGMRIASF